MFKIFLLKNIKRKPLYYLMITFFELFFLIIMFVSYGIMLDNTSAYHAKSISRHFEFNFLSENGLSASDLSDKINYLAENIPCKYTDINLILNDPDSEFYGTYGIRLFPDYETMSERLEEVWHIDISHVPTPKQFADHEKVVLLGEAGTYFDGDRLVKREFDISDDNCLIIKGEKYKIIGNTPNVGLVIFWGTEPPDTYISGIDISTRDIMDKQDISEIVSFVENIFGNQISAVTVPDTEDLLSNRKSMLSVGITVVMQIIIAFNVLLIFKYILLKRKKDFAVLRFCGFGKKQCIIYSCLELLLIAIISCAAACVIFDFILKQSLSDYYTTFNVFFTTGYYIITSALYIVISAVLFLLYIAPSISKTPVTEMQTL